MPFLLGLYTKYNTSQIFCKGKTSLFLKSVKNSKKEDEGNFCLVACQGFRRENAEIFEGNLPRK